MRKKKFKSILVKSNPWDIKVSIVKYIIEVFKKKTFFIIYWLFWIEWNKHMSLINLAVAEKPVMFM